jgi:hypothetical protein
MIRRPSLPLSRAVAIFLLSLIGQKSTHRRRHPCCCCCWLLLCALNRAGRVVRSVRDGFALEYIYAGAKCRKITIKETSAVLLAFVG